MKLKLLALCLCAAVCCNAQTQSAVLDANDTKITILNGGDFFWDLNQPRFEVPKADDDFEIGKSTIFSGAIWISGYDQNDSLHLAAMTYRQRGKDFYPGPSSGDEASRIFYDRIYLLSRQQIEEHKADPSDPITDIKEWPGNGDTSRGEPWQLAPFIDVNQNGVYEPFLGDYPHIKGAQAAYCIYNDQGVHTESMGEPFNFDVHQMFYQEEKGAQGGEFDHVNLAYFKLINRSQNTYHDVKFGVFVDFELGNPSDDYIGSDTVQNMIFTYNGDDEDEGALGYGLHPPSQGMIFLNTNLYAASYHENTPDPSTGNPSKAEDYNNLLNGLYTNGDTVKYFKDTAFYPTRHYYSGDPLESSEWTELRDSNRAGDRRMLAVAQPFDLAPGATNCIDLAFVYGRSNFGGAVQSMTVMKYKASRVQLAYYNDFAHWKNYQCSSPTVGIFEQEFKNKKVYPNPTHHSLTIDELKDKATVELFDQSGRSIDIIWLTEKSLDLSTLLSGIYILKVDGAVTRVVKI